MGKSFCKSFTKNKYLTFAEAKMGKLRVGGNVLGLFTPLAELLITFYDDDNDDNFKTNLVLLATCFF